MRTLLYRHGKVIINGAIPESAVTTFQALERIILWQDGKQIDDADISSLKILVEVLQRFVY
jgi:hypothetical protein